MRNAILAALPDARTQIAQDDAITDKAEASLATHTQYIIEKILGY